MFSISQIRTQNSTKLRHPVIACDRTPTGHSTNTRQRMLDRSYQSCLVSEEPEKKHPPNNIHKLPLTHDMSRIILAPHSTANLYLYGIRHTGEMSPLFNPRGAKLNLVAATLGNIYSNDKWGHNFERGAVSLLKNFRQFCTL